MAKCSVLGTIGRFYQCKDINFRDRKLSEQLPTDKEMAQRLAKLKGMSQEAVKDEDASAGKGFYHAPDVRAPAVKADDLMEQIGAEVQLEERAGKGVDPAEDIAERLARLKGLDKVRSQRNEGFPLCFCKWLVTFRFLMRRRLLLKRRSWVAMRRPRGWWPGSWRSRSWRIESEETWETTT